METNTLLVRASHNLAGVSRIPSLVLLVKEAFILGVVGMRSAPAFLLAMSVVIVDWHALPLLSNLAFNSPLGPSLRLFHLLFFGGPLNLALGLLVPTILGVDGCVRVRRG